MSKVYNIYCDESCHLENDQQKVMVLGAVWCPKVKSREIADRIREVKLKHGLNEHQEIKWVKVSANKQQFYLDLVEYFFNCPDLYFRALFIPDKSKLRHKDYDQTHDDWYYKMYFIMLKQIFSPHDQYYIYIDIKDTRGARKIRKLHEILCNNMYDFSRAIIQDVQLVRSHEIEQIQLTDLFIGAISYLNRGLSSNSTKNRVIDKIKEMTGYSLEHSTLLKEEKFNIFRCLLSGGSTDV
ncbi:MAG: DUF3800 domain-containing protein [Phycisphaerae bacterium]|jgi:hypothetical protein|nr:DUF3800 domain-containing protein [Phycisphaerae bacterium]